MLPGVGGCASMGVCFLEEGVCLPGTSASWGVCASCGGGGGCFPGGVLARGVCIPVCTEADTSPVNRMTGRRL